VPFIAAKADGGTILCDDEDAPRLDGGTNPYK
jgi:hypothetical protein